MLKTTIRRHFKHPILFALVLLALISGAVVFNWQLQARASADFEQQKTKSATDLEKLEKIHQEVIARKAAEEAARKRAAAEATAAAATTATKEQAATIDAATCRVSSAHADPSTIAILVNKKHCMQPLTYEPTDLVSAYGATLSAKAIDQFKSLYEAAAAAGQPFSVTSSYRSYDDQVSTYQYWVSVSGAAGADTYSARPGYSEHQTGLAFDVAANGCVLNCFGTTSQYQWMQQNAANYGFIQRYYAGYDSITGYTAEEWHYRYVGKDVALAMQQKGTKTLEEFWGMQGGNY